MHMYLGVYTLILFNNTWFKKKKPVHGPVLKHIVLQGLVDF